MMEANILDDGGGGYTRKGTQMEDILGWVLLEIAGREE